MASFRYGGPVVDKVANHNQANGLVLADQLHQPIGDRHHAPQRDEPARGALTQFVTEMKVRDGQPALGFVEKPESSVEDRFVGYKGLVRTQGSHSSKKAHWQII